MDGCFYRMPSKSHDLKMHLPAGLAKETAVTEAAGSVEEVVEKQLVVEAKADDTAVAEIPTNEPEEDKEKGSSNES